MNKKLFEQSNEEALLVECSDKSDVKSSSTSLSMQKKPETEQVQQKLEQYFEPLPASRLQTTDGTNGMLEKH